MKDDMTSQSPKESKNTRIELLPCPFCGGAPVVDVTGSIQCGNDECQVAVMTIDFGSSGMDIAAWNRRYSEPQQPAEPQTCSFKYSKRHGVMSGYVCGQPLDKPIHRKWDGASREGAIDISHDFTPAAEQSEPAKPQSGRCAQRVHAFGDPSEESDCGFPKR